MNVLAIAANVQVLGLFFGFWGDQFINYVHKRPFAIISETLSATVFVLRIRNVFGDPSHVSVNELSRYTDNFDVVASNVVAFLKIIFYSICVQIIAV